MGSSMSSPRRVEVSALDKQQHRKIEKVPHQGNATKTNQVKVLLLGAGDSGKTTLLKQMRLAHNLPFSPDEIETYRQIILDNLTSGLSFLLDSMAGMDLEVSEANFGSVGIIRAHCWNTVMEGEPFPIKLYRPLKSLWMDEEVRKAWERRNEAAVPDNLAYFFSSLDRLFHPSYVPLEQDIVHCRVCTTGITETNFQLRDHRILMVDVGGQRSERKKWIHCFSDVTSVWFFVSLSGYNQCLIEDRTTNEMREAMLLWGSIYHSMWFKSTQSFILFLNKNDLFEKKIHSSNIKDFCPDFDGEPGDAHAIREYFKRLFMKIAQAGEPSKIQERMIYIHITTATDTAMLRVVMADVEALFFEKTLRLGH